MARCGSCSAECGGEKSVASSEYGEEFDEDAYAPVITTVRYMGEGCSRCLPGDFRKLGYEC